MPSFQHLRLILYLKRAAVLLLVLSIGVGLYFAVQTDQWRKVVAKFSLPEQTNAPDSTDENQKDLTNFETFLESSSVQQLILKSTELVDRPTDNMLSRLERQQKKITIADKLLEHENDARAKNFGVASKLVGLRTRELINFDQGLTSYENLDYVEKYSRENLDASDKAIRRQARLGEIFTIVIRDLVSLSEHGGTLTNKALENFESICSQYSDDQIVASQLFRLLKRIHVHAPPGNHKQFILVFRTSFENSDNDQISRLAANVAGQLTESEFELVDIFDSIDSLRGEAVRQLERQIIDVLDSREISPGGYQRILDRIRDIGNAGYYEVSQKLAQKLKSKISTKPAMNAMTATVRQLRKQFDLAGQPLPLTGIFTFDDQPFSIRYPTADVKAVFFVTSETFKVADKFLFSMMRVAGRYVIEKRFCLSVVYVDFGTSEDGYNEVKKMSDLVKQMDFCRLDATTVDGKTLLDKISLVDPPMLILLDKNDVVAGVDVTKQNFEKRFFEILFK